MLHTLLMILLLEGFITISVEILTIRQLLPFFGGSVVITSLIIGIFLLFLAIGYWRGGTHHQQFIDRLTRNFSFSMLWIGFGLNYLFVGLYFHFSLFKLHLPFLASLTLYLLVILAPVVYWLGQTVPLATNLFNQQQRVSRISGKALFLSTIGSFLGAIATSLILFQYAGVAWTIVFNCLLLFVLILTLKPRSHLSWLAVILLALGLCFIKVINVDAENKLFIHTNNYANYRMLQPEIDTRILEINLSASSMLTKDKKGFAYAEFLRDLWFNQLNLKDRQFLIIGAGGFSLSAAGAHGNHFTYLDIDPSIKKLAEEHFLKESVKGRFIHQDARRFLNENQQKFDVILSDAYTNQISIPPSLLTVDYFMKLKEHLSENGLVMVNIIANPFFRDQYSQRVHNTIHRVFPYCDIIPLSYGETANIIYLCPANAKDEAIYTDNKTKATFDLFKRLEQMHGL